jgi:hypothetical protein
MQVDLTKEVKGGPGSNGGVPARVAAGFGMVSSRVGQPGVYQARLVADMLDLRFKRTSTTTGRGRGSQQ